jgi:hypothetical protein
MLSVKSPDYRESLMQMCLKCSDNCKSCSTGQQVCDSCYSEAGTITPEWIAAKTEYTTPFTISTLAADRHFDLNVSNGSCILRCAFGYILTHTEGSTDTDPLNQFCSACSDNCKTCGPGVSTCLTCFEEMTETWKLAYPTYAQIDLAGVHTTKSWKKNYETNTCTMQCIDGYFLENAADPLTQNCVKCSDNCKTCSGTADTCLSCFDIKNEISSTWVSDHPSYASLDTGAIELISFMYSASEKKCLLQCKEGYFVHFSTPGDFGSLNCIVCSENCKTCADTNTRCLSCREVDDDFRLWGGGLSYTGDTLNGWHDTKPFQYDFTNFRCNLRCKDHIFQQSGWFMQIDLQSPNDPLKQKCSRCSDNCKYCEGDPDNCIKECSTYSEVQELFKGERKPVQNITGMNKTFALELVDNRCKLRCENKFYMSHQDSKSVIMSNGLALDQRCLGCSPCA